MKSFLTALLLVVSSLGSQESGSSGNFNADLIVRSSNALAFQLYPLLINDSENTVFSPFAIMESMALTFAGADGSTEAQMARVLGLRIAPDSVNAAFKWWGDRYAGNPSFFLYCSLWLQKGVVNSTFAKAAEESYKAPLRLVDFVSRPEGVRTEMNAWIREKIRGKISNLVPLNALGNTTRMVVLSGASLKARWNSLFDFRHTKQAPFFRDPGVTSTFPTMHTTTEFSYFEDKKYSVIEIPYEGSGNEQKISLLVVLPLETNGLKKLEKELSLEIFQSWFSKMQKHAISVALPRFSAEGTFGLKQSFIKLSLTDPFQASADFSGMRNDANFSLENVFHKAVYSIDEWGSDGGFSADSSSYQGDGRRIANFNANHPFLFLVIDRATNAILLMGHVVAP